MTSSNDEFETLIPTTSPPLPDFDATDGDFPGDSTPGASYMTLDLPESLNVDAKTDWRMRTEPPCGVFGHVPENGGDQSSCVFDNRVYSPGGSTSSRCSADDDNETLTSHCKQPSPCDSRELTNARFLLAAYDNIYNSSTDL